MHIKHLADCDQHLETVANWQQSEFGYLNPNMTLAQRKDRVRACLQTQEIPLTLVALSDEGRPIGTASILARTITHPHLSPWLSAVVVAPEARGMGVASALSLRAAIEAGRLGFETIYLFTPRNESLYARLGWETLEMSEYNGVSIAIMARPTSI